MGTYAAVDVLAPVAVVAKNLKVTRVVIFLQPAVELIALTNNLSVRRAVVIFVVNREKDVLRLATARAAPAVGGEDFGSQLSAPQLYRGQCWRWIRPVALSTKIAYAISAIRIQSAAAIAPSERTV
jgi:hypothetical protein